MNDSTKMILVVLAILYFISPVDAMPGPIDDIIILIAAMIANKRNTDSD